MMTINTCSKCMVTEKQSANHYSPLMKVIKAPSISSPIKTLQSIPKNDQPRESIKPFLHLQNKLCNLNSKIHFLFLEAVFISTTNLTIKSPILGHTSIVTISFLFLADLKKPF